MKKEVGGGGKLGRNILKITNQKYEQAQGKEEETYTLRIHEKEAPGAEQTVEWSGTCERKGPGVHTCRKRTRPQTVGLDSSHSQPPGCAHDPGLAA